MLWLNKFFVQPVKKNRLPKTHNCLNLYIYKTFKLQVEQIENLKFKNERYIEAENEKRSDLKQQLSSLAGKSEEAIDKLNWKIEKYAEKIKEFGDFVNVSTDK